MRKPSLFTRIFGYPIVTVATALVAAWIVYEWWVGEISGLVAVMAVLLAGAASNAYDRLESHNAWKREWQAMSGEAPTAGRWFVSYRALRIGFGIIVWSFAALFFIGAANQPDLQIPAVLFWLGTAILVAHGIYRRLREHQSQRAPARDIPVTVCVPIPRQTVDVRQAYAALPEYCRPLFRRN